MSEIITFVYQLGLGAVGRFIAGFSLKKIAKLFIIVLAYSSSYYSTSALTE
jgi:uncharacterized membrane protein (Fun14 family)